MSYGYLYVDLCKMKNKIITILKNSGTTPAVLNDQTKGIYIWKNDVFCLKEGMDIEFDELDESEKTFILSELQAGNYTLEPTFQG